MADYLASIFGTEKDKVNCSFYFKIGACRHGEKCSKVHNKPTFSQTVLLKNLYLNPLNSSQTADRSVLDNLTEEELQKHFDDIFEELFVEIELKYGEIEEMNICDNLSEHLAGNTYIKFRTENDADKACTQLNNRWFNGKPIYAELSPVTDFHEACCRQYQMGECPRGGFCNFMHLKPISNNLRRKLFSAKRAANNNDPNMPPLQLQHQSHQQYNMYQPMGPPQFNNNHHHHQNPYQPRHRHPMHHHHHYHQPPPPGPPRHLHMAQSSSSAVPDYDYYNNNRMYYDENNDDDDEDDEINYAEYEAAMLYQRQQERQLSRSASVSPPPQVKSSKKHKKSRH